MNTAAIGGELERLIATRGARLALAASAREGLVLHAAGEDLQDADAVAALFASLYLRTENAATVHGRGRPRMLSVRAGGEQVLVAGAGELVLVVVAGSEANVGRIRLELLRAAEVLK